MAYMNQERKKKIAENLKQVVPAGWKYTLAVRNHSTIVMTIKEAPVDLIAEFYNTVNANQAKYNRDPWPRRDYADVNPYHYGDQFNESKEVMDKIFAALNDGNWDKSDPMTDYFNVGWYVDVNIGTYDKPFKATRAFKKVAA